MIDFLFFCIFPAFCLTLGGLLLNLVIVFGAAFIGLIVGCVESVRNWINDKRIGRQL